MQYTSAVRRWLAALSRYVDFYLGSAVAVDVTGKAVSGVMDWAIVHTAFLAWSHRLHGISVGPVPTLIRFLLSRCASVFCCQARRPLSRWVWFWRRRSVQKRKCPGFRVPERLKWLAGWNWKPEWDPVWAFGITCFPSLFSKKKRKKRNRFLFRRSLGEFSSPFVPSQASKAIFLLCILKKKRKKH